ncbi:hypothetical protein V498_08249, partial [Pseudogymnoascus sp. VKM F-4517 (FW-2822)]
RAGHTGELVTKTPKHQNASTVTTVNMPQPTQAQSSNQEGRIILAIKALKEGNIKSIRAAAMLYEQCCTTSYLSRYVCNLTVLLLNATLPLTYEN